ncbi:hypothetical protein NDU88_008557 [Pleurodeles waltl]|uniref:Uncharacterized protein n=1 Tax=Pleurodeles waltl TaxID=8319 RepID=A0AAV7NWK6_PLEWA|nr:hypothetical protein NDU88_008557 [Pleurodeles waltl]
MSSPKRSNGFPRNQQRNGEEPTAERRGGEDGRNQQRTGEEETTPEQSRQRQQQHNNPHKVRWDEQEAKR